MSLRKTVGLLAGFALAVGLIGAGVSASFTDSVSAVQHINVGTFGCAISSTSPGASLGAYVNGYAHSVSYSTAITSSTGTAPFNFTVTSTGTIPVQVTVTQPALSAPWSSLLVDPGPQNLTAAGNAGDSYLYNAGIAWAGLTNADLGTSGAATWTVNCGEVPVPAFSVAYYAVNNGGAQFAAGTWVRSTSPIASTAVVGSGTATQSISGGNVNLAITGGGSYADNGFYVPLGTVASLAASGFTVTGTGSQFGTNAYFDTNSDGFFGWTGNYLTSVAPDTYGLGPTSSGGTLTVTGASLYAMTCNGVYGNYSLTTLATTGCTEGVHGTTPVAVWVGITSTGAPLSTTITSAP